MTLRFRGEGGRHADRPREFAKARLPDLPEAHNEILASAEAPAGRYPLVNIEIDRIVTRLNTLSEQVAKYSIF